MPARDRAGLRLLGDCPTGKSLFLIYRINVKPRIKKYFAFPETQISATTPFILSHQEGRSRSSRNAGQGAVDAKVPETRVLKRTAKTCGPDVAVLASTHLEAIASQGATEAKEPFSGESTL
jgi:hypothetical protein